MIAMTFAEPSRPRRLWYAIAVAVAPVAFVLITVFGRDTPASAVARLPGVALPELQPSFPGRPYRPVGQPPPAIVTLTAGQWAIYRDNPRAPQASPDPDTGHTWNYGLSCWGESLDGGTIVMRNVGGAYNFHFGRGGRTWQLIQEVTVSRDGRYALACEPNTPDIEPRELAVGEDPARLRTVMAVADAAEVLVPVVVVPAGLVLVVWRRRARAAEREKTRIDRSSSGLAAT